MELSVVVLTFVASVGLAFAAAYVPLSILLFAMQRAVIPEQRVTAKHSDRSHASDRSPRRRH